MTYRDDPPKPTCPVCGSTDVTRSAGPKPYLCECWTVFDGTQGEWERLAPQRKQWAYMRAKNEEEHGGGQQATEV